MSRIYCSLDDVKRLLRSISNKESRIRFSSAYRDLKADSNNTGTISLTGVSFYDSFAEHETYTFLFSDSTSFEVEGDVVGYLGSGTTVSEFRASSRFHIPIQNWSGLAEDGDKVYLTSASDISNDDGNQFIADATRRINSKLERKYSSLANVSFYNSHNVPIPDSISFACIRYAAYDIFNSVFAGISSDDKSPVEVWKVDAEETLSEYIVSHGRGPVWRSRPLRVDEIGVPGINEGIIETNDLTDAKNKEYRR